MATSSQGRKPLHPAAGRALARMATHAGDGIRAERIRRRWSLAFLAGRAGISTSHLAQLEAGKPASLEAYARVMTALGLLPELMAIDPRARAPRGRQDEDLVHAAMGEVEARRLRSFGFGLAIDEPYQHLSVRGTC